MEAEHMSKPRIDSKGNRLSRDRNLPPSAVDSPNGNADIQQNALLSLSTEANAYHTVLSFFTDHDAGYLKVRRSMPGADLHLTWTWAGGENAGTYVYVRCEYWRILFGLEILRTKVLEVEAGYRRPTADKYGAGRPQ
jgi:hypothetical protein